MPLNTINCDTQIRYQRISSTRCTTQVAPALQNPLDHYHFALRIPASDIYALRHSQTHSSVSLLLQPTLDSKLQPA